MGTFGRLAPGMGTFRRLAPGRDTIRRLAPAAGTFVVALAWLLLLRPYGFQLEDEGTHLFWFDRVLRGQKPYLDFHTGYTPGFFALGSTVFSIFGPSATALRAVLAVINALTAAGLTEITRRVTGNWLAPIPALLWLAFMPVFVGEFAAFNVPYPTWPVTLAFVVAALAMLEWTENRRPLLLVLAGAAAATAMWFRPNSGAFALAGVTWVVVALAPRPATVDRVAALAASAFMAAGLWFAFEFRVVGMDAFVHLLPAFAVAALCALWLPARVPATASVGAAASLAIVAAAFVLPTLAWTLPLLGALGRDRFLYEIFLVGADYQTLYYKPHPDPEPFAILVVAAMLAIAGAGRLALRGGVRPLPLAAGLAGVGAVAKLALLSRGVAPEGLVHSMVLQLENASFWLAAVASFGAVAWLRRVEAADLGRAPRARALLVVTPLAIAMYAQMFPRSDFMHQVSAVPLTAVVACGLLDRVAAWWSGGFWPPGWDAVRWVRGAVVASAAAILVLVFSEKAAGPLQAWWGPAPVTAISPRLDVHVEDAARDELESVASTVAFLEANSEPGEELWSFPATSGLLFAAGRGNVAPHDYWYPGRPDREEEARVVETLETRRPRLIVTLGHGWNFFVESPVYFDRLRGFVREAYRLVARFGRYDVLARRDVAEEQFAAATIAVVDGARQGEASAMEAVLTGNLEQRRQAAWRWMQSLTPEETAAASLPDERREALLLLRALRDGGDMRGAAWALAGYESEDERIRAEAVDAMVALARGHRADEARPAGDLDAAALRPFVEPLVERARGLLVVEELRPFATIVAELSAETAADPGIAFF